MRVFIYLVLIFCVFLSCNSAKSTQKQNDGISSSTNDTIRLVNEELEYEVIIIESGFDSWFQMRAKPKGFYTQSFLENRNRQYVSEWNNRVVSGNYDRNLYEMRINYDYSIDYGFDLNYTLYHYFVFFEERYKQNLTGHNPRF